MDRSRPLLRKIFSGPAARALLLPGLALAVAASAGCPELYELRDENARLRGEVAGLQRRQALAEQGTSEARAVIERQSTEYGAAFERLNADLRALEERRRAEASAAAAREVGLADARDAERAAKEALAAELAATRQSLEGELRDVRAVADERGARVATLEGELAAATSARADAEARASDAAARLGAAEKALAEAQALVATLKADLAQAGEVAPDRLAAALRDLAAARRADVEGRCRATLEAVGAEAAGTLGLAVAVEGDLAALVLPADRLFESGSMILREPLAAPLARLGAALATWPAEWRFAVVGHTDNVPIKSLPVYNNTELGFRRAFAVARALHDGGGIGEARLEVRSPGEHQPRASNRAPEGRAANRRVLILPVAPAGAAPPAP